MIITEIQYFFSKIIRFQAIFKDTVEFTCALEFKISSQPMLAEAPWCVRINFNITIQSLIRHKNFQNYAHSCKQDSQIYANFPGSE